MPQLSKLINLASKIQEAHHSGEAATRKGLNHYRDAGLALIEAEQFVRHGGWLKFLEKVGVPERKAQRYIALAKSDVTSDIEAAWRVICGNGSASGEGKTKKESKPKTPDDGGVDEPTPTPPKPFKQIPLTFSDDEFGEASDLLDRLGPAFGTDNYSDTVLEALRRCDEKEVDRG